MRLTPEQIFNLSPPSTRLIYLRLEIEAQGRKEILIKPARFDYGYNRQKTAFRTLRKLGFQISWSRSENAYHVVFPEPNVNIDELLQEINQLEAAKTYQITRDMITVLRRTYKDMPAEDFSAALRNALISAQSAQIKPRALQRWLDNGIKQARDNNNVAAANKSSQNTTQNKEPQNEEDEWHKRLQETIRNRPDPEKLHMKLYGRPNP